MVKQFKDNLNLKTDNNRFRPLSKEDQLKKSLKGLVVMYDAETGKVIFEKENLVVLRGRAFVLEKLFDMGVGSGITDFGTYNEEDLTEHTLTINDGGLSIGDVVYKKDDMRTICLFKIGTGGAADGSPFTPEVPRYNDLDLVEPVPFVMVDLTNSGYNTSYTSVYDSIGSVNNKEDYHSITSSYIYPDEYAGNGVMTPDTAYMAKKFATNPEVVIDTVNNEVAIKMTLRIETDEARLFGINELGLFFAKPKAGKVIGTDEDAYENIEMFSRITFEQEMLSAGKQIIIDYFIYA